MTAAPHHGAAHLMQAIDVKVRGTQFGRCPSGVSPLRMVLDHPLQVKRRSLDKKRRADDSRSVPRSQLYLALGQRCAHFRAEPIHSTSNASNNSRSSANISNIQACYVDSSSDSQSTSRNSSRSRTSTNNRRWLHHFVTNAALPSLSTRCSAESAARDDRNRSQRRRHQMVRSRLQRSSLVSNEQGCFSLMLPRRTPPAVRERGGRS